MARAIGEIDVVSGGKTYCLRLTMKSLAVLQDEFGQDLGGIMNMKAGALPNLKLCLRMIELGLQKHHPDASADLADEIATADMSVIGRLISAAFPDAEVQDGGKPKAAGA